MTFERADTVISIQNLTKTFVLGEHLNFTKKITRIFNRKASLSADTTISITEKNDQISKTRIN